MSDEFDKEAEREKLRQKLEKEEAAREATQHMSELLLKGATMTNQHCGECGDPIFRHDGQKFCPTCEKPVEDDDTDDETTDVSGTEPPEAPEERTSPEPNQESPPPHEEVETATTRQAPDQSPATHDTVGGSTGDEDLGRTGPVADAQAGNEVATARATLVRTLARFAQRAEATDDPRRARDCLEAAREAAETIAAIDAAGR